MKQKNIVTNGKLSLDAQRIIDEYFAIKRVNEIEGFIVSNKDFIKRYQGTYAYRELRSTNYHAVYTVNQCDICFKPYDIIINDRIHLYEYLQATYKLCKSCKRFHSGLGDVLSIKLDGDIAS